MKAKVKESKKDINIDIKIENNLMSKNKNGIKSEKESEQDAEAGIESQGFAYDPNLPREVNEYYGIMAAKRLYETTAQPQPVNVSTFLTTPDYSSILSGLSANNSMAAPPRPVNNSTTAAPSTSTAAPSTSTAAPQNTSTTAGPPSTPTPVPRPSMLPSFLFGTGAGAADTMPSPIPPVQNTTNLDFEENPDVLAALNETNYKAPEIDAEIDDAVIENGLKVFSAEQETDYAARVKAKNYNDWYRREEMIKKLENRNVPYRIYISTIEKWNLGYHVKTLRPEIWARIKGGTWPYK